MNVQVLLEKQSPDSDPVVKISCGSYIQAVTLNDTLTTVSFDIVTPATLSVSRHEPKLYSTTDTCLPNCVFVKKIVLDSFWEIGDHNHMSVTNYDQEYVSHVKQLPHTYELSKTVYNNALFFNGSLDYQITRPIRKMFFQ